MTKIILVRHGEASASWEKSSDPGLSNLGVNQAEECAEILFKFKDIENFDKREKGYTRIRLKKDQIETLGDFKLPYNCKIYVYVSNNCFKVIEI